MNKFLAILLFAIRYIISKWHCNILYSLATALDFQEWCQLHGKVYKTAEEQRRREQVFYDNVKIVNQLNEKHKEKYGVTCMLYLL